MLGATVGRKRGSVGSSPAALPLLTEAGHLVEQAHALGAAVLGCGREGRLDLVWCVSWVGAYRDLPDAQALRGSPARCSSWTSGAVSGVVAAMSELVDQRAVEHDPLV